MNRFWWWIWRNEWIPLGGLAPYVLGLALGSRPHRVVEKMAQKKFGKKKGRK